MNPFSSGDSSNLPRHRIGIGKIWTKIREDFWILIKLKGSLLYYLGLEKKAEETSIQYLALGKSKRAYNYQYNKKIRLFSIENNKPCKVLKYDENKFAIGILKNSSTPYNNEINPHTYIKFFLQNTDKGLCI